MPVKRAAYKELRKAKKRHLRNIATKSVLRTLAKKFEHFVAEKKPDEAKVQLRLLISALDKAALKGIIHKNVASRKASRLTKRLTHLSKA